MAFLVTTTGTLTPVPFDDIGFEITHPTVDLDFQTPVGSFTTEEIQQSSDIQDAIDNGYITVTDENGNPITDVSNFGVDFPEYLIYADQFDNPVNADWATNSLAPAVADSNNNAETIRAFDDSTMEGVGFTLPIPNGATNILFEMVSRAETAPAGVKGVVPCVFERGIPNNGAVDAWSAGHILTTVDIPTNENFQYDSDLRTLSSLGLTAGQVHQFQFVREPNNVNDDLVGDWNLLSLKISFS